MERIKNAYRMMSLKRYGSDYPCWLDDLYINLQAYTIEDLKIPGLLEYVS